MVRLHVNIDHVATLRQARKAEYPDPVAAAFLAELAGADGITVHLREDRRHIQDRDVHLLRQTVTTFLNMEMAATEEMLNIALELRPDAVCIVPEKRQEITTEGGLDVKGNFKILEEMCPTLEAEDILVSLFIDPDPMQIEAAARTGASFIEIHTGQYANSRIGKEQLHQLNQIRNSVQIAGDLGLRVNAGHGLHYHNTGPVAALPGIEELNIGHAIVSRAVLSGLQEAVREMKNLILEWSRKSC
jgi:pyridoxine 5-phosphate synthase